MQSGKENYFQILGIAETANEAQILQAYNTCKQRFKDNKERLALINESFRTLFDPIKRNRYLNQLKEAAKQAAAVPRPAEPSRPASLYKPTPARPVDDNPENTMPVKRGGTKIWDDQPVSKAPPSHPETPPKKPEPPARKEQAPAPPARSGFGKKGGTQIYDPVQPPKAEPPPPQPEKPLPPPEDDSQNTLSVNKAGRKTQELPKPGQPRPQEGKPGKTPTVILLPPAQPPEIEAPPVEAAPPVVPAPEEKIAPAAEQNVEPPEAPGPLPPFFPPARFPSGPVIAAVEPARQPEPDPDDKLLRGPQSQPPRPAEPFKPIVVIRGDEIAPPPPPEKKPLDSEETALHRVESHFKLVVEYRGKRMEFQLDKDVMTIGRTSSSSNPDIPLNETGGGQSCVSRQHALLYVDKDSVALEDKGSKNGTRLNGQRISSGKPHKITDNDLIRIEDFTLRLVRT